MMVKQKNAKKRIFLLLQFRSPALPLLLGWPRARLCGKKQLLFVKKS